MQMTLNHFPISLTILSSNGANHLPILHTHPMNQLVFPCPFLLKNPIYPLRRCLRFTADRALADTMSAGGFDDLKATFTVDVSRAEGRPLNVPLIAPFTIASSNLDTVGNVAVRVELRGGGTGWGEAPVLPSVTSEDQPFALEAVAAASGFLVSKPPMALGSLLTEINGVLPGHGFASVSRSLGFSVCFAFTLALLVDFFFHGNATF